MTHSWFDARSTVTFIAAEYYCCRLVGIHFTLETKLARVTTNQDGIPTSDHLAQYKLLSTLSYFVDATNRPNWHNSLKLQLLLNPFNSLFSRKTWVGWYQKGKASLNSNEATDDGILGYGGISSTICKQSAPRSGQITTSTPHHSIFTGQMLFLMPN